MRSIIGKTSECKITDFLPEGQALGINDKYPLAVYNALPGEVVNVVISGHKKPHPVAIATDILQSSPYRQIPTEDHYLCCSPWQMMTWDAENMYKKEIAYKVLKEYAGLRVEGIDIINPSQRFGYRNKMDFCFTDTPEGLSLALHQRNSRRRTALSCCNLAHPSLNKASTIVTSWLKKHGFTAYPLKSLLVRCNRQGDVVVGLFVMDEDFNIPKDVEELLTHIQGLAIFYSTPRSPAAVITKPLLQLGNLSLEETLTVQPAFRPKKLFYGLNSFFQVNLEVFEFALAEIAQNIKDSDTIEFLDYYCGVGSISIAIAEKIKHCIMLESCAEAIEFAKLNITVNQLENFIPNCGLAETFLNYIQHDRILIIDPPRVGLHSKLLLRIQEQKPPYIIYLSCNIISCAKNIKELLIDYEIQAQKLYNFFPATPYSEYLVILRRKNM